MSKQQRKPGRFCFMSAPIAAVRSLEPVAAAVLAAGSSSVLAAATALQSSTVFGLIFGAAVGAAAAVAGGGAAPGCAVSVGAAGAGGVLEQPRSAARAARASRGRIMAAEYRESCSKRRATTRDERGFPGDRLPPRGPGRARGVQVSARRERTPHDLVRSSNTVAAALASRVRRSDRHGRDRGRRDGR